jgi:hypothetical protein
MAGFARVSFEGEYFNQQVVNVFHFRSSGWLPGQGNPFDDVLNFVDAVITEYEASFLAMHDADYTLENVKAVGYNDTYGLVTSSPLVRNVHAVGTKSGGATNGAAPCAIIGLRCGDQVQINGTGNSKRNRGYVAVGPLNDADVDNYSHLSTAQASLIDAFAQHLDNQITMLVPAVTLIPIRVHEKFSTVLGLKVLDWRTYSDVLGYTVNRVASYRRSRQPEA